MMRTVALACALSVACGSPATTPDVAEAPDDPVTERPAATADPVAEGPAEPGLTGDGAVEYLLDVQGRQIPVDGRRLPRGISLRRPATNHWSGHGISIAYPAGVRVAAEALDQGGELTLTDGTGAKLVIVAKPFVADVRAHLDSTREQLLSAFPDAKPLEVKPLALGGGEVHTLGLSTASLSMSMWGTQLDDGVAVIATLNRPAASSDAALLEVLGSLKSGARPATPELELLSGDLVVPVEVGEPTSVDGVRVVVRRRPTVLRRWSGLTFEHDPAFVVSEVPVPSMRGLQLSRPGMLVQFFLTDVLSPDDARASLMMAFPGSEPVSVTRTIAGQARDGLRADLATGDDVLASEVYAWKVQTATVSVLLQYDGSEKARADTSFGVILGSLGVQP